VRILYLRLFVPLRTAVRARKRRSSCWVSGARVCTFQALMSVSECRAALPRWRAAAVRSGSPRTLRLLCTPGRREDEHAQWSLPGEESTARQAACDTRRAPRAAGAASNPMVTSPAGVQRDPPKDLAGVLDESANTLFMTELVRGMMLTLKAFFDKKYTVRPPAHASDSRPRSKLVC